MAARLLKLKTFWVTSAASTIFVSLPAITFWSIFKISESAPFVFLTNFTAFTIFFGAFFVIAATVFLAMLLTSALQDALSIESSASVALDFEAACVFIIIGDVVFITFIDEVAFTVAHLSPELLEHEDFYPQILVENAEMIYEQDLELENRDREASHLSRTMHPSRWSFTSPMACMNA